MKILSKYFKIIHDFDKLVLHWPINRIILFFIWHLLRNRLSEDQQWLRYGVLISPFDIIPLAQWHLNKRLGGSFFGSFHEFFDERVEFALETSESLDHFSFHSYMLWSGSSSHLILWGNIPQSPSCSLGEIKNKVAVITWKLTIGRLQVVLVRLINLGMLFRKYSAPAVPFTFRQMHWR